MSTPEKARALKKQRSERRSNGEMLTSFRDIASSLERIRLSCCFAIERANLLPDGVRLAAAQVQDIRIERLEKGPQVTVGDALVPAMLVLCLEAPLAGAVLAAATRSVFNPIVALHKSRQVAKYGSLLSDNQARKLVTNQLLALGSPTSAPIRARFDALATAFSETKGVPALKGIYAGAEAYHSAPSLDAGDTAGVSIEQAAIEYATEQRLWITALYAEIEAQLLAGQLTPERLEIATQFDPIEDFAALRRGYKRFFEAVIWASLLRFGQKGGASVGLQRQQGVKLDETKPGTRQKVELFTGEIGLFGNETLISSRYLLDYWAQRIIDPDPQSGGTATFAQGRYPFDVAEGGSSHKVKPQEFLYSDSPEPAMLAAGKYLERLGSQLANGVGSVMISATVAPRQRTR